jgi:hemoglobin
MKDLESGEDIELLVNSFYASVQENEALNYIFNNITKVDWEHHLPKMYDFWETLVFHKVVYKGNPMKTRMIVHQLHKLKKRRFSNLAETFF